MDKVVLDAFRRQSQSGVAGQRAAETGRRKPPPGIQGAEALGSASRPTRQRSGCNGASPRLTSRIILASSVLPMTVFRPSPLQTFTSLPPRGSASRRPKPSRSRIRRTAAAAIAAGLACVVVPGELTREHTFPPESIRLESLEGIAIDRLTQLGLGVCPHSTTP